MKTTHSVTRLVPALLLSLSTLAIGALGAGCLAEPDDAEDAVLVDEAVGEAEQNLWVSCYSTRPECNDYCESIGRVWKGKCQDSAYGACVCLADIEISSGAGTP